MPKKKHKTIAFIQARLGSTRLPSKVLKQVEGRPLLSLLWERVSASKFLDGAFLLIPDTKEEDPLALFLEKEKIPYFRGDLHNVLERFYQAGLYYQPQAILRITADCPLIDPKKIDDMILFFHQKNSDYASNTLKRTLPKGMDLEIFSWDSFLKVKEKATTSYQKEHVTPYFYEHKEEFSLANREEKEDTSRYSVTVDTEEDFLWVEKIIKELYPNNPLFSCEEVIDFCKRHRG